VSFGVPSYSLQITMVLALSQLYRMLCGESREDMMIARGRAKVNDIF
tara:strand:- start:316 stop:456 length:141 start_codon:yes stop_codon:yes gene_type:complete